MNSSKVTVKDNDNTDTIQAEEALGKSDKIIECYKGVVKIIYSRNVQIDISDLPPRLIASLKKLATFANPEFFEAQRMRRSTWDIPRYICCAELDGTRICLPRGLLSSCNDLLKKAGSSVTIIDNRPKHQSRLPFSFIGELKPEQTKGLEALLNTDSGVLVAPPGSGKTVIGCALIAERKIPTLILVHRKQLVDQWKSSVINFMGISKKDVGVFSTNLKQKTGMIDIGTIQTIGKMVENGEIISDYGRIIIDECHHVPATSFELTLRNISARYFAGLTATPYRKDGLHAIIHLHCGPTVFTMEENTEQAEINRKVFIRETSLKMPLESPNQLPIHEVWANLIKDINRNQQIAQDAISALKQGHFPLILSDRKEHLDSLIKEINDLTVNFSHPVKGFILTSDSGKKRAKENIS